MKEIDWEEAPNGYPIWVQDLTPCMTFDGSGWHKDDGDRYTDQRGEFWLKASVGEYLIHIKPKSTQWGGKGNPPIDMPCEWFSDSQTGWQKVTILAYSGDDAWIQPEGKPSIIVGNPANFRPIKTQEQIAAEEREKAIEEMRVAVG